MTNSLGTNTSDGEDDLRLPASWSRQLLPARGKRLGTTPRLDKGAPERVRDDLERFDQRLRQAFARTENQPYAAAALAYLDGADDPRGAGAVATLMTYTRREGPTSKLRPELDAWILERGLPFAVCAAIETAAIGAWRTDRGSRTYGPETRTIEPMPIGGLNIEPSPSHGVGLLRALLARATDEEYAAVAAAVEAHRDTDTKRFLATLLMPERLDWAEDVFCRKHRTQHRGYDDDLLWHAITTADQAAEAGLTMIPYYSVNVSSVAVVVDALGTESLSVLAETLQRHENSADRQLLLKTIGLLPSDDAMEYLLANLSKPHVFEAAADATERFPVRALRTIARLAPEAGPADRLRMAGLTATHPGLTEAARASLNTEELAALDALLTERASVPEAPSELLPTLLTSPPWTAKRPERKNVVITGLQAPDETRLVWAKGEQERWSVSDPRFAERRSLENWVKSVEHTSHTGYRGRMCTLALAHGPIEFGPTVLEMWRHPFRPYSERDLLTILARHGTDAVPGVIGCLHEHSLYHHALPVIRNVEAARLAADWFTRLKSARAGAIAWIERHGADGARLLIPDALGGEKKRRRAAEAALTFAASRHGSEAIIAAAASYGEEAAAAIKALLDVDPLVPLGVKIPAPGAWANPAMLPQVLIEGREAVLPAASIRHLVTVLAIAAPEYPYAGIDVVAQACDRSSLSVFSLALFQQWTAVGSPSKDGWALTQLAHFADDETVRYLTPLIREWPGQSRYQRAATGLEVLGAIGSEAALRAIHGIAEKVKFKALKAKAAEQIDAIASELGLTSEQLADRLVPDFGLGEDATLVLDYGPRRFRVGFDEQLKPFVTDEDGKVRKSLPKPGVKDDAEAAEAAYQRFARLKRDIRTVAKDQVQRLERAMVTGRTWTVPEFLECFVDHPLMWHLARRLVWLAEVDGQRFGFRLAEDKTCTDVEEEDIELPESAVVRLAHPVMLGDRLEPWSEILSDYEILQPFEQLSRPVMALTGEELKTGRLSRFEGAKVDAGKIVGMTKRGWRRAAPEDAGVEPGVCFDLPEGGHVLIGLEPGVYVGDIASTPEQTLETVRLSHREDYWVHRPGEDASHPSDIDPVTASEVLATLARVTGRS